MVFPLTTTISCDIYQRFSLHMVEALRRFPCSPQRNAIMQSIRPTTGKKLEEGKSQSLHRFSLGCTPKTPWEIAQELMRSTTWVCFRYSEKPPSQHHPFKRKQEERYSQRESLLLPIDSISRSSTCYFYIDVSSPSHGTWAIHRTSRHPGELLRLFLEYKCSCSAGMEAGVNQCSLFVEAGSGQPGASGDPEEIELLSFWVSERQHVCLNWSL